MTADLNRSAKHMKLEDEIHQVKTPFSGREGGGYKQPQRSPYAGSARSAAAEPERRSIVFQLCRP